MANKYKTNALRSDHGWQKIMINTATITNARRRRGRSSCIHVALLSLLATWLLLPPLSMAHAAGTSYPVGQRPLGIAIAPPDPVDGGLGGRVYVTNSESGFVSSCLLSAGPCRFYAGDFLPSTRRMSGIAVDDIAHWVYMTNNADNSVTVLRGASVGLQTFPVGRQPAGIAVDSIGKMVYVVNYADGTVSVLSALCADPRYVLGQGCGAWLSLVRTITVGRLPVNVAVDSSAHQAFVTDSLDGTVSVINTATFGVSVIPVGTDPYGVTVDARTHRAYVTNSRDNTVSILDENKHNNVIATVDVGLLPHGIALDTRTSDVVVANSGDNTASVWHASDSQPHVITVPVGEQPEAVAIDALSHRVFVTNSGASSVSEFVDPDAFNIITVPVRFCVLEKTSEAQGIAGFRRERPGASDQGPIVASSVHTVPSSSMVDLKALFAEMNDKVWLPQAHVVFVLAGGGEPFLIPVDPDPTDPYDPAVRDGIVDDGLLRHGVEAAAANCSDVWNVIHPGVLGIPVVDVNGFTSGADGDALSPSFTSKLPNPKLCVEPRQLSVDDVNGALAAVEDGANLYGDLPFRPYILAHELGHALTLGHGAGVDADADGLEPSGDGLASSNPGPRIYDSNCDVDWQMEQAPTGHPPNVMEPIGSGGYLTPLQVEQARAAAALYPGSSLSTYNVKWIVGARCTVLPCGLRPDMFVFSAGFWLDLRHHTMTMSVAPWEIERANGKVQIFLLITSPSDHGVDGCRPSVLGVPSNARYAYLVAEVSLSAGQLVQSHIWNCVAGVFRSLTPSGVEVIRPLPPSAHSDVVAGSGSVEIHVAAAAYLRPLNNGDLEVISKDPDGRSSSLDLPEGASLASPHLGGKPLEFGGALFLVAVGAVATAAVLGSLVLFQRRRNRAAR
jgi:YVTN family beta-propeller protein